MNFVDEEGIELSLKYRQGYERDDEGSEGSDDIDEFGDDDSED